MGLLAKAVLIVTVSQQGGSTIDHIEYSSVEQCRKGMMEYVTDMAPAANVEVLSKGTNYIRGKNTWTPNAYFYLRCSEL
jgi:hypothetical protein